MVLVIRTSGTVKVTSWWRSGQFQVKKGQILKLIFLHKMGIKSAADAARYGESNSGLCFALRGLELLKIEFENLKSTILNSFFFCYNLAKKEVLI